MNRTSLLMLIATTTFSGTSTATTEEKTSKIYPSPARESVMEVAPALQAYSLAWVHEDLWARPELSRRDRSLITIAALIARNDTTELGMFTEIALDNGVTPAEISETITHLAFYAGRPNAYSAAVAIQPVFKKRGIKSAELPGKDVNLLPLDAVAERAREESVNKEYGSVAPGVIKYTTESLFRELWLRPALAPRDRSLITVVTLVTTGNVGPVPYHLNRAMDNGLTQEQASEILTQLAFYIGWPNTFAAMPLFKKTFESRHTS
ncbi:carboxymuconolactone decarboxylase family protein [Klebsiella oxytoca]|uniref:carboxymuconolactone decarboxylase family protein n=1 Tax=Klebsiella oxytoca TaxID=571 RepID=UPI001092DBE2|nr:carboxymuconolactone decarboxylase family protein [Klebsiella oxytoca]TGN40781.1 carboxymuconolactone decarboxylase family protein [Klebsiella oxytoca]